MGKRIDWKPYRTFRNERGLEKLHFNAYMLIDYDGFKAFRNYEVLMIHSVFSAQYGEKIWMSQSLYLSTMKKKTSHD